MEKLRDDITMVLQEHEITRCTNSPDIDCSLLQASQQQADARIRYSNSATASSVVPDEWHDGFYMKYCMNPCCDANTGHELGRDIMLDEIFSTDWPIGRMATKAETENLCKRLFDEFHKLRWDDSSDDAPPLSRERLEKMLEQVHLHGRFPSNLGILREGLVTSARLFCEAIAVVRACISVCIL